MRWILLLGLALAGSPADAATLVVLNKAEATASFVDLDSGDEVTKVPTGAGPHEAATSPDGKTVVICDYGAREPGNTLTVVDPVSHEVVRTIDLGEHRRPHGIVYLDARRVVVTCEGSRSLVVVDVETGQVLDAVDTDADISHMVAVTPDGSRAFVANIGSGSVTVIDLAEGERIADLATGAGAEGIDISPDGREVWVGNREDDTLTVVDATTLEIQAQLPCASFPIRVKFTPDGSRVLVSNARSGDVAVFDAATREEVARVSMDASAVSDADQRLFSDRFGDSPVPVGILVHPDGSRAWIANTNADVVTEIDLASLRILRRLTAGQEPDGMTLVPDRD